MDLFFALTCTLHQNLGEVMPDCVCKWIWRNHSSPLFEWADWFKKLLMKEFQRFVFNVAVWDTSKKAAHTISNLQPEKVTWQLSLSHANNEMIAR